MIHYQYTHLYCITSLIKRRRSTSRLILFVIALIYLVMHNLSSICPHLFLAKWDISRDNIIRRLISPVHNRKSQKDIRQPIIPVNVFHYCTLQRDGCPGAKISPVRGLVCMMSLAVEKQYYL